MAAEEDAQLGGDEHREHRVDQQHRDQPLEPVTHGRAREDAVGVRPRRVQGEVRRGEGRAGDRDGDEDAQHHRVDADVGEHGVDPALHDGVGRDEQQAEDQHREHRPDRGDQDPRRACLAGQVRAGCARATAGPRMPASGQARPASTNSGTRCTRTTPAIRAVAPARRQSTPIHGASSSSTGSVHSAARARQVRVNGSRLCRAAYADREPGRHDHEEQGQAGGVVRQHQPGQDAHPGRGHDDGLGCRPARPARTGRTAGRGPAPGRSSSPGGRGRRRRRCRRAGRGGLGRHGGHGSLLVGRGGRTGGRAAEGRSTRSSAPDVPAGGSANRMAPLWRVATQRAMARPEPGPARGRALGGVGQRAEPLERALPVGGCDPRPLVGDVQPPPVGGDVAA